MTTPWDEDASEIAEKISVRGRILVIDDEEGITGGAFTPRARDYLGKVDNLRVGKPFEMADFKKIVSGSILAHRTKDRLGEPKR
ncbi:MAG: hypothetical protein R6V85_03375 [Polyangia bacterium]